MTKERDAASIGGTTMTTEPNSPRPPDNPTAQQVGDYGDWYLAPTLGESFEFYGTFLGMGTSQRGAHIHPPSRPLPPNTRPSCGACRWSEIRLWRVEDRDTEAFLHYVIMVTGASSIEGEKTFTKLEYPDDAAGVIRTLTTRKGDTAFIGHVGKELLKPASELDDAIRELYETVSRAS